MNEKEVRAISRFQRVSPRKTRLVANNVTGMQVEDAMNLLQFTPNKAAKILLKVVQSAYANAEVKTGIRADLTYVKEILVDPGPAWKRFMPRAQGRATKIHKRTSHITVILVEG